MLIYIAIEYCYFVDKHVIIHYHLYHKLTSLLGVAARQLTVKVFVTLNFLNELCIIRTVHFIN
jgi:hypothetical protein